jgi:predicted dehydrogenase
MPAYPLRAALLGTGDVARLHAQALHTLDGVELVAASSRSSAEAFCRQYDIPRAYDSLGAMLEGARPDVVHLCTPPDGHAAQAAEAFAAGAHVVTEKPAALSLHELDSMLAAAQTAGRELAVVFQQRTGSAAAHVRSLLESGALGSPLVGLAQTMWYRDDAYYAVPWRGRFETEGGGTTLSHSIHQIDLMAYLLGDWEAVSARMWRLGRDIETEDTVTGVVRFRSGALGTVLGTVLSPRQVSAVRIDTTVATVELEHLYGHVHENWRVTPVQGAPPDDRWAWPEREVPSGHQDYLVQVYAALLAGEPLPPVAQAPSRAMEIVTALYASAREDGAEVSAERVATDPSLRGPLSVHPFDPRTGG